MLSRRQFVHSAAAGLGGAALARAADTLTTGPLPAGTAEHCILIWLGGGMAQIDTFDPKRLGDAKARKAGSHYPSIPTSVPGVEVCAHLPRYARLAHQGTILRTVHHDVVDEHAAATNRMHTGRRVSGTVVYPSIGSLIAHQRGPAQPDAPPYVLIGYPNVTRGPGFLGPRAGFLYLTDTASGPAGLQLPPDITPERAARRQALQDALRPSAAHADARLAEYDEAITLSRRLSGPGFMPVFDLAAEPAALRESYGGEFGQRCLLARRLIQRGVRFVEVSHNLNFINGTGWDTHNEGQLKQHLLIRELDQALAALLTDLDAQRLLERTLVVVNTEFGRPGQYDSGGGRGHHGACFSLVFAGGGLRHCGALGVSNDLAEKIVERPISVPDAFATLCCALGVDPGRYLYDGDRPVPVTDGGRFLPELFA
jgi:hypothetical protein